MSTSTPAARLARDHRPGLRDAAAWRNAAAWRDNPAWRDDAACRDADPDLFFADSDTRSARAQVKMAKLICRACPVRAICLSWALASRHEYGVWGGLTEDERLELHRRSRPSAADRWRMQSA